MLIFCHLNSEFIFEYFQRGVRNLTGTMSDKNDRGPIMEFPLTNPNALRPANNDDELIKGNDILKI